MHQPLTLIAILLNLASGGFVTAIYSMIGMTYYITYRLTPIAALLDYRSGRMPARSAWAGSGCPFS